MGEIVMLCCQSGNAARRGHPKNWCGAVA